MLKNQAKYLMPEASVRTSLGPAFDNTLVVFAAIFTTFVFPLQDTSLAWVLPRIGLLVVVATLGAGVVRKSDLFSVFGGCIMLAACALIATSFVSEDLIVFKLLGEGRLDGLIYQLALLLLALAVYSRIRQNPNLARTILIAISISGVVQALIVFAQLSFDSTIPWFGMEFATRPIVGSIGHNSIVSGYLATAVLAGIAAADLLRRRPSKYLLFLAIAFSSMSLGWLNGRAAVYGLLLGLMIFVVVRFSLKRLSIALIPILGLLLGMTFVPGTHSSPKDLTDTTTLETRLGIWGLALNSFEDISGWPVVGGGPAGFRLALLRGADPVDLLNYYSLEYQWPSDLVLDEVVILHEAGEPIRSKTFVGTFVDSPSVAAYSVTLDRAHNLFLDILISYGAVALGAWAVLYIMPVLRGLRRGAPLELSIAAALIGVLTYYLVWFPVPQTEPIHILLIGILWGLQTPCADTSSEAVVGE